jgi:hypothetical protein
MNNSTLWAFGCSHTAYYYLTNENKTPFDRYVEYRCGNVPKVWPEILSENLKFKLKNFGIGGSSNYTIFSKFIQNHKKIKSNDIVIIGWTSSLRSRAAHEINNNFVEILPFLIDVGSDVYSTQTLKEILNNRFHSIWYTEIWEWISIINSYCKNNNISIYHWSSDSDLFKNNNIMMNEEKYSFIKNLNGELDCWQECRNLYSNGLARISEETLGVINDTHNGEFGHKSQAKYFYDYITNKNV